MGVHCSDCGRHVDGEELVIERGDCPMCWSRHNKPYFREKYGDVAQAKNYPPPTWKGAARKIRQAPTGIGPGTLRNASDCPRFGVQVQGRTTPNSQCPNDGPGVPPKGTPLAVHACLLHGLCTPKFLTRENGVHSCQKCNEHPAARASGERIAHARRRAGEIAALPAPVAQTFSDGTTELLAGLLDPLPVPVSTAITTDLLRRHQSALLWLKTAPIPLPPSVDGRGIITCGGGKFWPGIVLLVKMLREIGCTLPVQVWRRASAESIYPEDLDGLNVTFHDSEAVKPYRRMGGWEQKTHALIHSGFREAMFLDADAYCVRDPAPLFDLLEQTPFVFWEDLHGKETSTKWTFFGLPRWPGPTVQGGQILIDVVAFWRELVIAHWLNQHSEWSYRGGYGDQDQWRVALALTGGQYLSLGRTPWKHPAFDCGHGGVSYVVHRCQGKFDPWPAPLPPRNDELPMESRAFEIVASMNKPVDGDARTVFEEVYRRGHWSRAKGQTPSGAKEEEVRPYIQLIKGIMGLLDVKTVVDLGCGDGYVTRQIPGATGLDCVAKWDGAHVFDIDKQRNQIPEADLCLMRDVLQHWPNALVIEFLSWARASGRWRWIICTQDVHQQRDGEDTPLGGYRALHPHMAPLRVLGMIVVQEIGHKAVLALDCRQP